MGSKQNRLQNAWLSEINCLKMLSLSLKNDIAKKVSNGLCINRRIKQQNKENFKSTHFPLFHFSLVFMVIWLLKK